MKRQKLIILPRLDNCNGDLSKRWFIFYSCISPVTGKMQRFRVYEGFTEHKTRKEKNEHGNHLVAKFTRKLKKGWDPFNDKKIVYQDNLEYHGIAKKNGRIKENKFTFEYYLSKFLSNHKAQIRLSSYHSYVSKFRVFRDWLKLKKLENTDINYITVDHSREFIKYVLETKKRSPRTVNEYIRLVKALMNELVNEGEIKANPFRFIKNYKAKSKPAKYFKPDIQKKLKQAIEGKEPQLWLFSQFIYYTFIRPIELRYLKLSDMDFSAATITIREEIAKNKKEQKVVIPTPLFKLLIEKKYDKYPPDYFVFSPEGKPEKQQVGKNYFSRKFRKIRDDNNLSKEYKLYSFKHTGATNLAKSGAGLKEIQMQLRHHSLDQVDVYLQQMQPEDSEAIRNNFPEI